MKATSVFAAVAIVTGLFQPGQELAQPEIPKVTDPRLVVELVAQQPEIVHPISCDFDHKGRLLVIESHTHFAPKDYQGPKFDRIKAFDVKTGKATIFFEGTRHTMDLAVHPDGSVYIATRNEILRLRETPSPLTPLPEGEGKGVRVKSERIVFLDTKGDYPHNGLSGLCFDSRGDLYFGMGENSGKDLKLIGTDGTTYTDEQGGHIFHCSADGKKLRRVATGFWNPFGICRDIFGRVFAVDNDPDQSPPCRMVHVVEGGDYGYRYNYGRSGRHPFQSWHGELPGTLPMMTGVGEAPCEILSYESDGLPGEYRGKLMVTSWADHRVELYKVVSHGASFKAERQPFVQGGNNFRPVGLCVAPDGSLYVTDWVRSDYTLHGKGAIWRIREKASQEKASRERKRPENPREAIFSMHWPLRESAAKKLASDAAGRAFLHGQINKGTVRTSSAALIELIAQRDLKTPELANIAKLNPHVGMREIALREIVARRDLEPGVLTETSPAPLIAEGVKLMKGRDLVQLLANEDPFIRHAAVRRLREDELDLAGAPLDKLKNPQHRIGILLASRMAWPKGFIPKDLPIVDPFLDDRDENVRFLAVKWVADEKLTAYRKDIDKLMADPKLSVRMYMACATALARIDGQEVSEKSLADYFAKRLADDSTPAGQRAMLLRQMPANHPRLTVDLLAKLLKSDDAALKLEVVRALAEHPNQKKHEPLLQVLRNPKLAPSLRGFAMIGLTGQGLDLKDELVAIAKADKRLHNDVVLAVSGRSPPEDRPPQKDIDAWLKRLDGKADPDFGARVFFSPMATCSKCHRIDGRGQDVGPDLSNIGRTDRRHILESILQPSANVAPHYVAWHLEFADGKVKSGMLVHTNLDDYTYLDAKGERFRVRTSDLVEQRPTAVSIMPEGLVDRLTDQEVRDLLAYLQARK
jgi:putative membrane-bound dehydrogenase-like protein